MTTAWRGEARRTLLGLRRPDGGWGYRAAGEPAVEPTVLAAFGLLATEEAGGDVSGPHVRKAAAWVAGLQRPEGSVGVSAALATPEWPTPYAVLLWQTLGGFDAERKRATTWLLGRKGEVFERPPQDVLGHDTTIAGWPWVAGTHSWLEPTVMAVLALCGEGFAGHERTRDGLRLIRDRAIPDGGWNYGNSAALGTALRPQPAPTGLALLALAGSDEDRTVRAACDYLEAALPETRSPQSLCWGVWGLSAWGRRPDAADAWLADAWSAVPFRPDPVLQLGYLLMASGPPLRAFLPTASQAWTN